MEIKVLIDDYETLIKFSRGFSNLYEDGKLLLAYLLNNHGAYTGTMLKLGELCNRPRVYENGKIVSDQFAQFRRLGILKLKELGVIEYHKLYTEYNFKLKEDWLERIIEYGNVNRSRSHKYKRSNR